MIYLEEVRDISSAQEPIVAKIVVGLCARYGSMELPVFRYVQKSHPQICIDETVITVTAVMAQNMDLLRKLRDDGIIVQLCMQLCLETWKCCNTPI